MRVTNQIMTNNTLSNINTNKVNLMDIEEKYQTGKKIQRPSDDPVVAVRALKLRNSLSEISHYSKKNIPDAESWMQVTESALREITEICTTLHTLSNHGAQDTLKEEDRMSIMKTMAQYREQIYQEGNASYAGRYVFTGYKTDTSYTYLEVDKSKQYEIRENFSKLDIKTTLRTVGGYEVGDYELGGENDFSKNPENVQINTIRLSYKNLDVMEDESLKFTYINSDGDEESVDVTYQDIDGKELTSISRDAYEKPETGVKIIRDTGEIILSDEVYEELKNSSLISIEYKKSSFEKGDVRPEHYFDCVATPYDVDGNLVEEEEAKIHYKKEDQDIEYEVSFNQRLQVNTQAKDGIPLDIGRELDGILSSIEDVNLTENKLKDLEKLISNAETDEERETLSNLKERLKTEVTLKKKVMQERFSKSLTTIKNSQDTVNKAIADLGSREARLELTSNRLTNQFNDFTELMSNNENADLVETIINFNSQNVIYNASLNAAARVVQNSLLDFLR